MMKLSEVAQVLNGRIVGPDVHVVSVSSDSRKLAPGELFIALRGEHFDGYEFAVTALQSGAAAVMVNADSYKAHPSILAPSLRSPLSSILLVEDTRIALGQLAAHWRKRFDIPLVAITGSNGKTTVKEMLASILSVAAGSADNVLATKGNLNNDIGMPLTLLQMKENHRYAVIEMGMNHLGEIDYLSRIAEPDVAVINNAGSVSQLIFTGGADGDTLRVHGHGLGSVTFYGGTGTDSFTYNGVGTATSVVTFLAGEGNDFFAMRGTATSVSYDGEGGIAPHLSGLIDAQSLNYDDARSGQNACQSAPGRGLAGGWSAPGRTDEMAQDPHVAGVSDDSTDSGAKTHVSRGNGKSPSYSQIIPLAAKGRA